MRKQFLIFFLAIFIGSSVSFANNDTKSTQLKIPTVTSYKSTKTDISNSNFSCQSTKSWSETGSGTDCEGNTITITVGSSCTVTRAECFDADADAFMCAVTTARNRLAMMLMFDCG